MNMPCINPARWRLMAGACALLWSAQTQAQDSQCSTDADCGVGFDCAVTGSSGCAAPDCKGEDCPVPVCEEFEYRSCVPGACASDADCSDGLVCHTSSYSMCSG